MRQIELYPLSVGDIRRRIDGKVGLKLFAKRSERVIPLPEDIIELFDRHLEARKKAGGKLNNGTPIFISLASNHYCKALSRRAIQDYLGHADPKTTAIYAHIADLWHNNPATTINLSLRTT